MIIKVSKIVPKGFIGITLWPFGIYVSEDKYLKDEELINHEKIHWAQQKEMVGIIFYIWYGIEYLIRKLFTKEDPYKNLSFEREANDNENNLEYLSDRKRYSWIKKIF